jgi:hypothetical protein
MTRMLYSALVLLSLAQTVDAGLVFRVFHPFAYRERSTIIHRYHGSQRGGCRLAPSCGPNGCVQTWACP